MYRAITRADDLIAWWPFDDDPLGANVLVTGKSLNAETANLFDAEVTNYGRFGKGIRFYKEQTDARMRINNDGVDIGASWTLSSWVKNILPPVNSGISTLYRGEDRQSNREYDRYLVIRGSNGMLHSFDGADWNANNRYRNSNFLIDSVALDDWHLLTVVGEGSRTSFFLDGVFVGNSDRKDDSDVYYVGNSSNNELFAEYLDDVRIYNTALSAIEVSKIYGGGFGDQFPSLLLEENSSREATPRSFKIRTGKDNTALDLSGFNSSDWILSSGSVTDMNSTNNPGESLLFVDFNGSNKITAVAPFDSGRDSEGKQLEAFHRDLFSHELVYGEAFLLSRWSFEEANGTRIRDRGLARNDGFLVDGAQLTTGKFGNALSFDGSGDYFDIPRFRGIRDEGNFTISAWVKPAKLGTTGNGDDGGIFCTDTNGANTVQLWYNVNAGSTGNRTFTLNVGSTNIALNRLDGTDGLAKQDRWQHLVAIMAGQKRLLYFNGSLVAESIGSDNLVSMEGSGVRLGGSSQSGNFDFEGESRRNPPL